jgi:hypothetical protein
MSPMSSAKKGRQLAYQRSGYPKACSARALTLGGEIIQGRKEKGIELRLGVPDSMENHSVVPMAVRTAEVRFS